MHYWLRITKHIAVIQLVYSHFATALDFFPHAEDKISLYKSKNESRVVYISGIALRLINFHHLSAMEIANNLATNLSASCGEDLKIQVVSPGWLHLELADSVIATWLQSLISLPLSPSPPLPLSPSSVFTVQYAHARCCSIVRLGKRDRLISLDPIPWLNDDGKLRLNQKAENRLIAGLVKVVDDLASSPATDSVNWQRKALSLSQAFEGFWGDCRIWGDVKTNSLELAQARLGLVMATKSVLRFLLEEKLGIFAPDEL